MKMGASKILHLHFTFMYLKYFFFIQSDLDCASRHTLFFMHCLGIEHMNVALLAPSSTLLAAAKKL